MKKKKETEELTEKQNDSNAEIKQKKTASVRQYLVIASNDAGNKKKCFILATCGLKARECFLKHFEDYQIIQVMQTAESEKTADWLKKNDGLQSEL